MIESDEHWECRLLSALFLVLLLFPCGVRGADNHNPPIWYETPYLAYPEDQFIVGVAVGVSRDVAESMQSAEDRARANLVRSIRTHITASFLDQTTQSSNQTDVFVQSRVASSTDLEVDGIRIAARAQTGERAYAIAVLHRVDALRGHADKLVALEDRIREEFVRAGQLSHEHKKEALNALLRIYPLVTQREETEAVLGVLAGAVVDTPTAGHSVRRDEVDVALSQLTNSTFRSLDDAAATLAYRLTVDLAADKSVVVLPFTFQQSDFASPFSRHFDQILRLELTIAGIDVFDPNVGAPQDLTGDQHGTDYVISGSYVPQASGVTVFGYATDLATGRKVGAAELLIDTVAIADHASLRPQNFEAAMSDMGIFATGELIPGTLQIEAWTSRGDRNLILAEDDEITLAIRGSEPCYLQIVYHLADGRRALLYNNYYIDHGRANHVVVLPDTFIVAEPLGVEVLQVFASNERFAEVNVSPWEGYDLLAEDLDEFVSRTRGLKKKKKERKVAEARLTVTTMKSQ